MYYNDHLPAHFHARYAEHEALVSVETLEVIQGEIPQRAYGMVLEWAALYRNEIRDNWERARAGSELLVIKPLE